MNKILKLASDKWSGKTFRGRMYSKILVLAINSGKASPDATTNAIERLLTNKTEHSEKLIKKIKSSVIQEILINFRKYLNKGIERLKDFNIITKYAEYILNEDEYAITNNDFVAVFNQMGQDLSLPARFKNKVNGVINSVNKDEINLNLELYEEKVSGFKQMTEEEFSQFVNQLYQLRNKERILPEKYCDYLLRMKIDKNSPLSKNFKKISAIYYRAYEDKALHALHKKGIYNYLTSVEPLVGSYGDIDVNGRVIIYDKNTLSKEDTKSDLSMINALFHEVQHAYQFEQINIQNQQQYYVLKEKIIEYIAGNLFYEQNYSNQHMEIDANIIGTYKEIQLLGKLGMYARRDGKEKELKRLIKRQKTKELKQKTTFVLIDGKRIVGRKYEYTDVIFQKVLPYALQQDPELFEKYPELKREFNLDGTRRGNMEILREYEEKMVYSKEHPEEKGLKRLYPTILKNQSFLGDDTIMKDAQELLQYQPINGVMAHYRDLTISNKILPRLRRWEKNNSNEVQHANLKTLTSILNQFIIENPDLEVSKKIATAIAKDKDEER